MQNLALIAHAWNCKAGCGRRSIKVRTSSFKSSCIDRFSGKSSVLESFSELPFPRDSGLCTRFVTQIIFRRDAESSIKISIIPGPGRSRQEAEKLRSYHKDGLVTLTGHQFLEILHEVSYLLKFVADKVA